MEESLLTAKDVMLRYSLSEWQLRQRVKSGELPAYRVGGGRNCHLRFRPEDVETWWKGQRVAQR